MEATERSLIFKEDITLYIQLGNTELYPITKWAALDKKYISIFDVYIKIIL